MYKDDFIEHLKGSNLVYFVYRIDDGIYNIDSNQAFKFILVTHKEYKIPTEFKFFTEKEYVVINDNYYKFITIEDWFECLLQGSLLVNECICLPRKYIIKEHVKLTLNIKPDFLKKDFYKLAREISYNENNLDFNKLWESLKYLLLADQLLINHKIINLGEIGMAYKNLIKYKNNKNLLEIWKTFLNKPLSIFKKLTFNL